ncbi:MAG: acyltransferase [Tissierellales bacterium]|nr:acyltransferase [Tissierellales bacterium]
MSKNRLKELDYIRIIACYSVILVHITAIGVVGYLPGSTHLQIVTLINRSIKYTTPVFLFLSGVTSFYSYRIKSFNYLDFLKKRLPRILVPYFFWNLAYYAVYVILGYYSLNVGFFAKNLLLGTMSYHLYFIVILTQLYFLAPLFHWLFNQFNHGKVLFVIGVINFIAAAELNFKYSDRIFLKYMFFYALGIYLTLNQDKFLTFIENKKTVVFSTLGYLVTAGLYTYLYYVKSPMSIHLWFVYSAFSILFLYVVGLFLATKIKRFYPQVQMLSRSSFYIYLMHPLLLSGAVYVINLTPVVSLTLKLLLYVVIVIPISTILSVGYNVLKDKLVNRKRNPLQKSS